MIEFAKTHYKKILIILALTIVVAMVAERFITQGTLLGYQVRRTSPESANGQEAAKPSQACDKANGEFVGSVLSKKVERIASGLADQEKPLRSVCSYATVGKGRRYVTIAIRDLNDEKAATAQIAAIAGRKGSKKVERMGQEAYFSDKSRQLNIRQGVRLTTVTVSDPSPQSKISSLEAAEQIANKLL